MQLLTDAARNYMMATRPPWAKYFTVDSRMGCYFWSHKPRYNEGLGIYCRVEGEYQSAKLPQSVSAIEEIGGDIKKSKSNRPALYVVDRA